MKQETMVEGIVTELMKDNLIDPEKSEQIAFYLFMAFGIGYDQGRMAHIQLRPVVQLTMEGKEIQIFESIKVASNKTGTFTRDIAKVANGKRKAARGYRWRFLDQYYRDEKHGINT